MPSDSHTGDQYSLFVNRVILINSLLSLKEPIILVGFPAGVAKKLRNNNEMQKIVIFAQNLDLIKGKTDLFLITYKAPSKQAFIRFANSKISFLSFSEIISLPDDSPLLRKTLKLCTIRNCYTSFYLLGDNGYATFLRKFLLEAKGKNVEIIKADSLKYINGHYECQKQIKEPSRFSIFISCNFLQPAPIISPQGKQYLSYFLRSELSNEDLCDWQDVVQNLIPALNEKGVKTIILKSPDFFRFSLLQKLLCFLSMFSLIKYHDHPDLLNSHILKRFHEKQMIAESKESKVDLSRGYPIIFHKGRFFNYSNGFRDTIGNGDAREQRVIFYGPCTIEGHYVPDSETVPSLFKKFVGSRTVVNRGITSSIGQHLLLREDLFQAGDVVFLYLNRHWVTNYDKCPVVDLTASYKKTRSLWKHVGDTLNHCDGAVSKAIASASFSAFQKLKEPQKTSNQQKGFFSLILEPKTPYEIGLMNAPELIAWLNAVPKKKEGQAAGAIVMNCNPFTKGHRFLIETASKEVDCLYVFVVEEDKSIFPFRDRIELVKKGTSDLRNVIVTGSGKFMISSATLPGYFDKTNLGSIYLDASSDLELFASIAKNLGISTRFAGSEPTDNFTNQYNNNMSVILPKYGINFRVIERIKSGDLFISASTVRRLLSENKFDEIKKIVPDTTFEYLIQKFQKKS